MIYYHTRSLFLCVKNWVGQWNKTIENLVVYKYYYHRMQVRAEDDVFSDDAVEFEWRQPGDKHHRAAGSCSLHARWRTRN